MQTAAWLILALPLAGCIINALGYRILPTRAPGIIGTAAIAAAFACAIIVFFKLQDLPADHRQVVYIGWDYAKTFGVNARVSLLIDPLSVLMALVVTGVSTLIH